MITSRFNLQIPFYLVLASLLSFGISLFFMQLFLGILTILWLLEKNDNKKKAFDKIGAIIIIFGAVRIISILLSEYFSVSVEALYKEALFYFAFFALSFYLKILDEKKLLFIFYFFVIASALISLTGIILFNLNIVERAQSFSSGYTTFSSLLLAGFGFGIVPTSYKIKNFPLYKILALSIILTGIITSLGRTSIALAGLLFLSALILRKIKITESFFVLVLSALLSLISFYNNDEGIARRVENPAQLSDRDIIYKGAKEIMFEHPLFGYGPRTFKEAFPITDQFADKGIGGWHNDFLQIYFESGIIGLISFLILLYFIYYYLVKLLRKNKDYSDILYGILFSVTGFVLSAVTAGFITSVVLSIVFVFIISLLSAVNYKENFKIKFDKKLNLTEP